ncbi:hypothetical protein PHISP_08212 [Aspergillus sp. HF37]|nr:hypothetical protein PHISP_08212 [Aspergillus sp. HF37]
MAPPRRGAVVDDSRSEASNGPREPKGKSRRGGNGASATRDAKAPSNAAGVTSAPAHGQHSSDQAKVPWPDMPLEILHSYRHAHKLGTPSAFSNDYSHILLSGGIGLRSPTSLAARRRQASSRQAREANGTSSSSSAAKKPSSPNGVSGKPVPSGQSGTGVNTTTPLDEKTLHQVIGQGRVSKKQLAQAVRKHYNNAGLGEQEAIARFLYKVREEGRGHHFRLRFQP